MATLGSQTVGSAVKLNVNGTAKEFIVVHQGKPSSLYDDSCNGTWLLMKGIYEKRVWNSSNNDYENSDIHAYLNGTFLGLFDSDIQSAIKQVKLPYRKGTGSGGTTVSGSSGLSAKVFLLGGYEVGWTTSTNRYFPVDGACLSYFSGTSSTDSKRIAYYGGGTAYWWLRSPFTGDASSIWVVGTNGGYGNYYYRYSYGVRPALVLPANLPVSSDGTITGDPMTPKDGHNTLISGAACQIEGGQVNIGGTVYEIESGNAMADDGTIYGIPFKAKHIQ